MLSVEEYEKRLESGTQYAPVTSNVASLLSVYDTMDFQEKQTASDKAANVWNSFWNGVKSVGRGTAQGLLATQYDNYVNAEETPAVVTDDDAELDSLLARQLAGRDAMTAIASSDILKPKEVRANSSVERYAYNAIEGIGQLGAQAAMAAIPGIGQVAAPASMYYQILGSEYEELRGQGVDHDTAYKAAQANALIQAPMESLSLSKMMKAIPANTLAGRKVRMFVDKVLTEVVTEGLQQLPEDISKMYAFNPDKTAAEIAQMAWDKKAELFANALYAGAVAFPAAFLGGGLGMAFSRREVNNAIQREIYNERIEHVESTVNRIKETGINPQYAAAVVNDNMQNQEVHVDGAALFGYAQEAGAEKVAESLGVSVETIEKAAADGDTVDIKLGNYEATGASFDGFLDAVRDDTAFEDGGYTVNKDKREQAEIALAREKKKMDDAVQIELDRIEGEMKEAAKSAGVKADVTREMINLLSRARMWSNPAEVLKKLSIRYGENAEGYAQFAGENAETADKVKLVEAQQMEADGKAADEIYKQTGWFKGLDNRWRFEIKDNLDKIDFSKLLKFLPGDVVRLSDIYDNSELFNAYPWLKQVVVVAHSMEQNKNGSYARKYNNIHLNKEILQNNPEEIKKTLIHEIQHAIQHREGFAVGGTTKSVRSLIDQEIGRLYGNWEGFSDDEIEYLSLNNMIENATLGIVETSDDEIKEMQEQAAELGKAISEEDKRKITRINSEIRRLEEKLKESEKDAYGAYFNLGGEQEARVSARRASLQNELAQVEKEINNAQGDDTKKLQFVKTMLERQLGDMPSPHTSDAIIVFDGQEIPYSENQDESLAGENEAAEKNVVQAKIPWQDGSMDRAVFDKYLGEKRMETVRNAVNSQISSSVNLDEIATREDALKARENLDYIKKAKIKLNQLKIGEDVRPEWVKQQAVRLEYARRCFDNDERIRTRIIRQMGGIGGQTGVYQPDNAVISQNKQGTSGGNGGRVESIVRDGAGYSEGLEDYLEVYNDMEQEKHLPNASAFSVSQTTIPNSDGTSATVYRANLNRSIVNAHINDLENRAKQNDGNFSAGDMAAFFTRRTSDFEAKKAELLKQGESEETATKQALQYADKKAENRRDNFIYDADKYFKNRGRSNQSGFSYAQNRKGNYNPATNIITLFKGADASTVIHETWHFFVEQMWQTVQDGTASEQTVKDFETLLNYAGMTMEEWEAADVDGRRKAHEKLAEAGETYIMEGNAPSHELRRVFKKFAQWLKDVYRTLQRSENYAEITDEVREVFDRMLAAEDDIAEMERINGYFAKLPDVITDNMSDETRAKVEDYIAKAREKAVYILTRRALKDYSKKRREEVKKFKEEIRPSVEAEFNYVDFEKDKQRTLLHRVYKVGYDKADAARFRMLQDQMAGAGIWTADDFIDRAFSADVSKVQNEVAHLAAAMNPKNWKKGLADLRADYVKQRDEILQPALDALDKGMGQGVDIIQQEDRDGRGIRVSNNAQWYRDFFAEHKRKPNKTELREMARQLISGDTNAPLVEGWTPTSADVAQAMAAEGERLADIERHIEACKAIEDRLAKLNENYNETSAAGSERFLLEANMTAEQYGYSSADEMMKDIEQSPTKARAINQRINEIVAEMSNENEKENYENAIRESLYNEDEALLIGVEQQLIEEYAEKAKERQAVQEQRREERKEQAKINAQVAAARKQQAKNLARNDLAKMNMKEATRTSKFMTAERNAAVKCAQLLAKKKFDEALTQKNLQAYWHAMASESIKIARRKKQNEKFVKAQVKLKPEAWLNETHFAAISKLFERMGIARPVHRQAAENAEFETLAAYAAAMKEQFDCVDIAPWILDGKIPISDTNALTLEQYEDVVNTIKNIKAIVKAQKGVNMFSTQEAWAGTKAHIMGMLAPLKTLWEPNPNKVSKPNKKEQWLAGLETMDTVCDMLDGGRYGWFSQHWNNLIKRCQDREYDHRKAYDDAETEAYKKWVPDKAAEAAANEEVYYEELGTSVTKHTLVRMLMNLGNKENSQRICETVPVGFEKSTLWVMPDESLAANQKELRAMREEAREATRQNLIDFLGKVLTEEDVKYAQRRINAMEMFWGERVELDKRTKGFAPKKVEATPVLLDIGGKQVVLQGGYCPLLRYGETGSHSAAQEVNEDEPLQGKNIRTYHTNTSSSKARTNARYPVDLRLGTERNWIYESIHDLCWREAMSDFRRVLNDQEVYAMLKSKMGLSRMNLFKELLEVSADGRNSKPLSEFEKSISETAGWLTSRTTNALVMCSLKISSQNLADCLLYGNAVEGYTMADNISALGRYMLCFNLGKWKEMQDFVFSKSAYMEERSIIPDVTIRDMMADEREKKWQKVLRETTTKMFALTDNATAIPNWMQAYNKKINEGWAEQDAIDFADTVVRRVKGSSRNTEISSMQRSKVLKPITMFQSFFNARFNEFVRMERYATNQWTDGQKAEAFSTVASYVMAKVLAQAMLALALAAENPFGIDDEDKWPNLIKELKSQTFSMFGPIGQAASAAVGAAAGMREFDYRMSAIESTVNKGIGAIKAVRSDKKTAAEKVEVATNFATLVSGAPMQITGIFWNAFDIVFNNMSPEIGDIMRRRPKNERK